MASWLDVLAMFFVSVHPSCMINDKNEKFLFYKKKFETFLPTKNNLKAKKLVYEVYTPF
jgi:hypothetical protein